MCTHNILSVSYKALQEQSNENPDARMQLPNLRQGESELVHVFIGLRDISFPMSSESLRPEVISRTGIPSRPAMISLIC